MSDAIVQFKKGLLELCVLSVLARKDCYGYELVESISPCIEMAEGTVYPLLKRLQALGYCSTYLRESNEGPPRKYYSITRDGRRQCELLANEWNKLAAGINALLAQEKMR